MTEAQRAHLRILESTPRERITTHEQQPFLKPQGYKRNTAEERALQRQLREMERQGVTRQDMSVQCKCSPATIVRLLGRCKVQRGRHARPR